MRVGGELGLFAFFAQLFELLFLPTNETSGPSPTNSANSAYPANAATSALDFAPSTLYPQKLAAFFFIPRPHRNPSNR